jgi:hypothetical protein
LRAGQGRASLGVEADKGKAGRARQIMAGQTDQSKARHV